MISIQIKYNQLIAQLATYKKITIATSGGIDSTLLAFIAHNLLGHNALIVHSISPAVPPKDTERLKRFAQQYDWNILYVDGKEMQKSEYQTNPVNRCYYCKTSLYSSLCQLNHGHIISGTNLDDLKDYRPGLIAAQEYHVVHPYVDCKITKEDIRRLANDFNLPELATLPSSPCLSSRIETGITINELYLSLVYRIESYLRQHIRTQALRCRIRKEQISIELDSVSMGLLSASIIEKLTIEIKKMALSCNVSLPIAFASYQQGSAFIGDKSCQIS